MTTVLPAMVNSFKKRIGKENRITNKVIVERMKAAGYSVNDVRVRKIINHIRRHRLVPRLIATDRGYYVAADPLELKKYLQSLDGRESAIKAVKDALTQDLKEMIIDGANLTNINKL